jgi:preprotein translocase subunit SecD
MGKQRLILVLILGLVLAAIVAIIRLPVQLGLDLQGGSQLTLQVQVPQGKQLTANDLEAVRRVMENRVNESGVAESLVQTAGQDKIVVQLPGVSDPQEAERRLKGTAQLDFRSQKAGTEQQLRIEQQQQQQKIVELAVLGKGEDQAAIAKKRAELAAVRQSIREMFEDIGLTGQNLKDAFPEPANAAGNAWNVGIRFDGPGGEKFAQLTKTLAGTGRSIGIFLDNELISAPVVGAEFAANGITGGSAVITGNFTAETSNDLAVQLRGGALPFPVAVLENRTVGATLGRDSVQRSIYAGLGGLFLVLIFMVVYYRLPGVISAISLMVYALLTFAVFTLIPEFTLTLPGIAGFILSIGMAVDANVLIFERTREELRDGKSLYRSIESGFYRAFSSILDGNVTTLIACAALGYWGTGLVRGFAVTLAVGVLVSMFTAITCSRNFLLLAINFPNLRKPHLYCPGLSTVSSSTARAAG